MMTKLTKKGALAVTAALDEIANLFQTEFETLGIEPKIANDFAWRCDLLSGAVEAQAGLKRRALTELDVFQEPGFDPELIGEETSGPLEGDADESYMKGNFGQEEKRELRYDVEGDKLGPDRTTEDQKPLQPGRQAGFVTMGKQAAVNQLSKTEGLLHSAALRFAQAGNTKVAQDLTMLAKSVMDAQIGILTGTRTASNVSKLMEALNHILPHVATVNPNVANAVTKMASLALKVAKKAEEDEVEETEEDEEDDEKESSKKKSSKKSEEEDDDKEDDDKDEEPKEDKGKGKGDSKADFLKKMEEGRAKAKKGSKKSEDEDLEEDKDDDEPKASKKASHSFNLNA